MVLMAHPDEFTRFGEAISKPFSGVSIEP